MTITQERNLKINFRPVFDATARFRLPRERRGIAVLPPLG
jgi:hypothetical protein